MFTSVESLDGLALLLNGLVKLLHLCLLFYSLVNSRKCLKHIPNKSQSQVKFK